MEQKMSRRAPSASWILVCSVDRPNTVKSIIFFWYHGGVQHAPHSTIYPHRLTQREPYNIRCNYTPSTQHRQHQSLSIHCLCTLTLHNLFSKRHFIFVLICKIKMTLPKQSVVWSPVRPQAEWSRSVRKAKNWEETTQRLRQLLGLYDVNCSQRQKRVDGARRGLILGLLEKFAGKQPYFDAIVKRSSWLFSLCVHLQECACCELLKLTTEMNSFCSCLLIEL